MTSSGNSLPGTISHSVYPEILHGSSAMPLFVLDNFRSAFNVGSVFRSAESVSPAGVLLCGICCRPGNRKLARTARGTQAVVPWMYFRGTLDAMKWAGDSGRTVVAVENVPGAVPFWELSLPSSPAFVFGSEADGLHSSVLDSADCTAFFPQSGGRCSINVASTAAMAAFEVQRRRMLGTWICDSG